MSHILSRSQSSGSGLSWDQDFLALSLTSIYLQKVKFGKIPNSESKFNGILMKNRDHGFDPCRLHHVIKAMSNNSRIYDAPS